MAELLHRTPGPAGVVWGGWGGINTLCFLTACYSRRLLASWAQSGARPL